jgi:hypothetical protein
VPDRRVLKRPLKVTFVGEPGIDEGGLRKELFILLSRQVSRTVAVGVARVITPDVP